MDESAAQRRRVGATLFAVMVVSAVALAWPRRRVAPTAVAPRVAVEGPASAGAVVPREARGVLRVDVAAMRRQPAFASWFEATRTSDPCAAAIEEHVTRAVVMWSTTALEEFVVAAEGSIDEGTFRRCAAVRRGRTVGVAQRTEVGLRVLALSVAADGGVDGAETWRLPSGVVLLGPPSTLRSMLLEARAHPTASEVTGELAGLWADVPAGAVVAGVRRMSSDTALDPALAHARSVSAWVTVEGGSAVIGAVARCDNGAGATALAAALTTVRAAVPDFTARVEDDRVRVRATLDAARLEELRSLFGG